MVVFFFKNKTANCVMYLYTLFFVKSPIFSVSNDIEVILKEFECYMKAKLYLITQFNYLLRFLLLYSKAVASKAVTNSKTCWF